MKWLKDWKIWTALMSGVAVTLTVLKLVMPPIWHMVEEQRLDAEEQLAHKLEHVHEEVDAIAEIVATLPPTPQRRVLVAKVKTLHRHIAAMDSTSGGR